MNELGRAASLLVLWVLLASACSSAEPFDQASGTGVSSTAAQQETSPTSPPTTTPDTEASATSATTRPEPAPNSVLNEALLVEAANTVQVVNGAFMIAVLDAEGTTLQATVGTDADGSAPTAIDVFRVGSITKVFTALTTLMLVDDGLVDLDAPASDYVTRVSVPEQVTVRHLLGHRSGIFDTTSVEGFIPQLLVDQNRVWTPEEQLELIADRAPAPAGLAFSYSNSNYVILGVLIEEVTGLQYHDVVRTRIIDPLDMTSTYLAGFEEGPQPFDPYTNTSVTDEGEEYDYTSIASAAWSAGSMVSSAPDLHALFSALFDDQIISADLVEQMTSDGANLTPAHRPVLDALAQAAED